MDDFWIDLRELTEVRTLVSRSDPAMCALALRSGGEVRHYELSVADLARLGERLKRDAELIIGTGGMRPA